MDSEKDWVYLLGGGAIVALLKWVFGEKQKMATDNKKADAETGNLLFERNIKSEEYYEKQANLEREKNERYVEKIKALEERESNLLREMEELKIKNTTLTIKLNSKNI